MSNRFRLEILFFCVAAFSFCSAGVPSFLSVSRAQDPDVLTLGEAAEKALKNNPLIRVALSGQEIADAELREARAGWFPLLQFGETFTRSNNPVFVFGSLLEQARFTQADFNLSSLNNPDPLSNFRTALTLRQALFDRLQTYTRVNQAKLGQRQSELQKELVEQQIRFEVIRTYYGVLVALGKKDVAEEAVRMAEAGLKQSRDRFRAGLVVESDPLAAEVQVAEFRQQRIQADGDLSTAYAALNSVMGVSVDTPQRLSGELVEKEFQMSAQEELIRTALGNRADYLKAGYAVLVNSEAVRGAKREYLPRLDVMANYGESGRNLSSGSSDYAIATSLTFNIFDPGRGARVSKARAAESMAAAEREHLASQIRLEVVRAYQQYVSARERRRVALGAADQALESHRILRNRYREGLTTITEVLRAETALVRARLNLLAARYDQYVSHAHVLLSIGKLSDVEPFMA